MVIDAQLLVGLILLVCVFLISIPFEKRYAHTLSSLAHEPVVRVLGGAGLLWAASVNPALAGLVLVVLFLWIADIQLLSSLRLYKTPENTPKQ